MLLKIDSEVKTSNGCFSMKMFSSFMVLSVLPLKRAFVVALSNPIGAYPGLSCKLESIPAILGICLFQDMFQHFSVRWMRMP